MSTSGAQPPVDWEKHTDITVGEVLRRTRVHYGLTLDDVAASLHIRAMQLGALESGETDKLPGRVYAIGFVRAYAEFLGLDGDRMVHLFKAQSVGGRVRPELTLPAPASESKAPNKKILVGSVAALLLLFGALVILGSHKTAHREVIPAAPQTIEGDLASLFRPPLHAALIDIAAAAHLEARAPATPAPDAPRIVIHAVDTAWIEVRNAQNKSLFSNIIKAGDSYAVANLPGLRLDTGNLGALQILVDGKAVPPLGKAGDVRRGIQLDPDALQNGTAVPPPAAADAVHKTHKMSAVTKPASPDDAARSARHADHFTSLPGQSYNQ